MTVEVAYVHPMVCEDPWRDYAIRFVASYHEFPPGERHISTIICNGGQPTAFEHGLFSLMDQTRFFWHDNSGMDIGAYQSLARNTTADLLLCLGASVYFWKAGWLKRILEAWERHGPGLYGFSASHQGSPHLNTTLFCCPPRLLVSCYPEKVNTNAERYAFENSPNCFWRRVARTGAPVFLITWNGDWPPGAWALPQNGLRRGDQSNLLAWFNHTDGYLAAHPAERQRLERLTYT